jgi:hypothetical protein
MTVELTLEQRAIAMALVEYLKSEGYVLSPEDKEELEDYRRNDDSYVTGKKASDMIGCSQSRIIALRDRGLLRYIREGSVPRYSVKSIKEYIRSREINRGLR